MSDISSSQILDDYMAAGRLSGYSLYCPLLVIHTKEIVISNIHEDAEKNNGFE